MTRINTLDPTELMDQHLVAEYHEITMVGGSLLRSLKSKSWNRSKIPAKFTLNKGHVMFFYDKGLYLEKRYNELVVEMKKRGMNPDATRKFNKEAFPDGMYNDWTATEEDRNIVRERIKERIAAKPDWYRKTTY